jgi:hypothetical protein
MFNEFKLMHRKFFDSNYQNDKSLYRFKFYDFVNI